MTDLRISAADTTDMTNSVSNFSITPASQDTPSNDYTCDWNTWYSYYNEIPELQAIIDAKARWTTGKGYKTDKKTAEMLDKIDGNGKDTFLDILYNGVRVYTTGGDFFAEKIRNKRKELKNLKPMNPAFVTIKTNEYGRIIGYWQKIGAKIIKFSPDEIFHLQWNRLGDECHGISTIKKLINIIDSRNEAMKDLRIVFHRYVKPLLITEANTDDPTELAALKVKQDRSVALGENMIIAKGSMAIQRVSIPQYSTLDPLPWIQELQKFFIMAEGVPEVVLGYGRDTTEASSKVLVAAFQQMIEHNQNFIERQLKAQLGIEIELEFPIDMMQNIQQTENKAGNKTLTQPADMKVKA